MTTSATLCSVCAEAVERHTEAYCSNCGDVFHLNQRTDLPGKDCGDAWINGDSLALEFGCQRCLNGEAEPAPESALDEIVDASEGAAWLGISESELVAAADGGQIVHRRTSSGIYLFERASLTVFGSQR